MCNVEIHPSLQERRRGNGFYCSRACVLNHVKVKKIKPENNVFCSFCDKSFYKPTNKLKNSKSGLYFCCREHKDLSQRLGGIKEIQPKHYGTGSPSESKHYRNIAFSIYPHECNFCGYKKFMEVLQVHHIDRNRNNDSPENLVIVCPTCHEEQHYLARTGRYRPSSKKN